MIQAILLYHRVDKVYDDPHLLSVSPSNFYDQIKFLKDTFTIITLSQMAKNLDKGQLKRKILAISFDDGYVDNLSQALPTLEKLKIPATFFVTADQIGNKKPFYWDEKTKLKDQGRAMTKTELLRLSQSPFVEIGSHTLTHPHLSDLSLKDQKREIFQSRLKLEKIIKSKILGFSYPFGGRNDFSLETISLVRKAGYDYSCANFPGLISSKTDPYILPRYLVRDWNVEQFKKNLRKIL